MASSLYLIVIFCFLLSPVASQFGCGFGGCGSYGGYGGYGMMFGGYPGFGYGYGDYGLYGGMFGAYDGFGYGFSRWGGCCGGLGYGGFYGKRSVDEKLLAEQKPDSSNTDRR